MDRQTNVLFRLLNEAWEPTILGTPCLLRFTGLFTTIWLVVNYCSRLSLEYLVLLWYALRMWTDISSRNWSAHQQKFEMKTRGRKTESNRNTNSSEKTMEHVKDNPRKIRR